MRKLKKWGNSNEEYIDIMHSKMQYKEVLQFADIICSSELYEEQVHAETDFSKNNK